MVMIRKAEVEDLGEIQTIAKTSWNHTYSGLIPEEVQSRFLAEAYSDEMMPMRLSRTLLYVAEENGKLIGFANASQKAGIASLHAIYLLPETKGKGTGTKLLQKLLDEMAPIQEIQVEVEKGNTSGERFYEARGFKNIEEYEEDLYGHILRTKKMVLKIKED